MAVCLSSRPPRATDLLFGQVLGCDQGMGVILASQDPMCFSNLLLCSLLTIQHQQPAGSPTSDLGG